MKIGILETNSSGNGWFLIKALQKNNFEAVFITTDINKYHHLELNPALLTETLIVGNSYSVDEVTKLCKNNNIDCLIAPGDYQLEVCSQINANLKGYGPKYNAICNCKYKDKTRKLTNNSKSSVDYKSIDKSEDVNHWKTYPAIIKPINGSGSCDVYVVSNQNELNRVSPLYFDQKKNNYGYQFKRGCQIEEFIEGIEYSAECYWNEDQWEILTYIKKYTSKDLHINENCVELLDICNVTIPNQEVNRSIILNWLNSVNLDCSVAHIEFKIDNGIAKLIEINPRLPGDRIVELIYETLNIDVADLWINSYLSNPININHKKLSNNIKAMGQIIPKHLGHIESITYCKDNFELMRTVKLPIAIEQLTDNDCRLGSFIILGDSTRAIKDQYFDLLESINIEYVNSN
ncbi:ATP-grasp domain-containing protein [bacterium]|nr:ATP-grasp domain-containing protein [bacterium]